MIKAYRLELCWIPHLSTVNRETACVYDLLIFDNQLFCRRGFSQWWNDVRWPLKTMKVVRCISPADPNRGASH